MIVNLIVEFSPVDKYSVPLKIITEKYNVIHNRKSSDSISVDELDSILEFSNTLNWKDDIAPYATKIEIPISNIKYEDAWKEAHKEISL